MTEYLVELYVSRNTIVAAAKKVAAFDRTAAELTADGTSIRFVRSIFIPEDETLFLVVEAVTAETVHEAARGAALPYERIVETAADLFSLERSTAP